MTNLKTMSIDELKIAYYRATFGEWNAPFNTREEYLAWVAKWKADWLALSNEIRETKRHIASTKDMNEQSRSQGRLHSLRHRANVQMLIRALSKKASQQQYLAAREAVAAA